MPDGWDVEAMAARVLAAGLCKYSELTDKSLSMYDFFAMLRIADWLDYSRAQTAPTPQN